MIRTMIRAAAFAVLLASPLAAQELDRSVPPAPGPTPEVAMPDVQVRTLPNGLTLWVVETSELPTINAVLTFSAGSAQDGNLPGLAGMTAELLDDGAGNRDALEFARAVDLLGIGLGAFASEERISVSLSTLTRTADSAFALMGDLVMRPTFAAEEIERERKSRIQSLRQQQDQASTVATLTFNELVYGSDHPYGRPSAGTIDAVGRISRDDIQGFYSTWIRPNNAVLVMVGDITPAAAQALAQRTFGKWEKGTIPASAKAVPSRPEARSATGVFLVDKPGAAQSEIRIGHAGVPRTSKDYYPLQVMNALLGGQFTSRINLNLREDKGYTYGARSGFSFDRGPGPFVASAGVFTAKTDSSLIEFMKELRDIRTSRPATEAEVNFAKGSLVQSYPRMIETNSGVASRLAELAFFGLPPSELARYPEQIEAVTIADVTRVAKEYLHPDNAVIVVVGDLSTIRGGIDALRLGPVTVVPGDHEGTD